MTHFGLIEDYDYNATHKRKRFTIWSGPFASVREGVAYSLPKGDGFMVTTEYGGKIRVTCPVERTDANYKEQDKAFNDALNEHFSSAVADGIDEYAAAAAATESKPFVHNGKRILNRR